MKNCLIALIVFGLVAFCAVSLWTSGFEAGYETGSTEAWNQANEVLRPKDLMAGKSHLNKTAGIDLGNID